MRHGKKIAVVIPALNEERSIGRVIEEIPGWVDRIVVADNGSTDRTGEYAAASGRAEVVVQPERGYGAACLAGINAAGDADVVVFLDADLSDYPSRLALVVDPVAGGRADLCLGSRRLGIAERGSLTTQQRWGNALACRLMRLFWGAAYTDLGPLRAISSSSLRKLAMADRNYGWTIEMQVKAVRHGLTVLEVPVDYRRRIGFSKVSGTVRGVIGAGSKILYVIFREVITGWLRKLLAENKSRLIVFSRFPTPGRAKTRLIPELGETGASRVQRMLTRRTVGIARSLTQFPKRDLEVCFHGGSAGQMRRWLGPGISYVHQCDSGLGGRMNSSLERALAGGARSAVLIGTDIPGMNAPLLERAFELLEQHDVVIGPAADGGYYLVGLRRSAPQLFSGITWSRPDVFSRTLDKARQSGLSVAVVDTLSDLDTPDSLTAAETASGLLLGGRISKLLSVVVPTLNERANLLHTLSKVLAAGEDVELIVADGGSSDGTPELARSLGARIVDCPRGRAVQMNRGAEAAAGEYILFLHADTLLPAGFDNLVRRTLEVPDIALGAFRLDLDDPLPGLRVIERTAQFRSRVMGLPFGDQALFVRAEDFRTMGGYPEIPLMEDYELVRRMANYGRVVTLDEPVLSSARRWRERGFWRVTVENQLAILGYQAHVSQQCLMRLAGRG